MGFMCLPLFETNNEYNFLRIMAVRTSSLMVSQQYVFIEIQENKWLIIVA